MRVMGSKYVYLTVFAAGDLPRSTLGAHSPLPPLVGFIGQEDGKMGGRGNEGWTFPHAKITAVAQRHLTTIDFDS